ncbi:hypothetical protein EZS27_018212 [termite gut metagenome]|uniref:Uncharacterized protein n=1 Tax=termite gut metagenome TaxID=433724 RepID=A0A5J4RJV6_9ZZZZ
MNIEKSRQAVIIMLRETMENEIRWNISPPDHSKYFLEIGESILGNIYCTVINGKNIRLFQYKFKGETHYRLEIYDINNDSTLWIFPPTDSIRNLYDQVLRQFSGVEEFLEEFLEAYDNKTNI